MSFKTKELLQSQEITKPFLPTLYKCSGVSAAGCTTAITKLWKAGLALPAPFQFTSRTQRSTERPRQQYVFLSEQTLDKIPQHCVVFQHQLSSSQYGILTPAVNKIRRSLKQGYNVIIDSIQSPQEWKSVLGKDYHLQSVFLMPSSARIATQRLIARMQQNGMPNSKDDLKARINTDAEYAQQVLNYDYWLDTNDVKIIFPALQSLILATSYHLEVEINPFLKPVSQSVNQLDIVLKNYRERAENF